jgi:rhodanese-related sulfurtransferase
MGHARHAAGDTLLFFLGRYMGWALLSVLCRVSLNPETCIIRSAETFYKRGKLTLLFAKFVPGVNTMAPPLAGSMKMRLGQFLRLDLAGAFLYAGTYTVLGFLFRDFVVKISRGIQSASHAFAEVVLLAVVAFITYRVIQYRRYKMSDIVPRIAVTELAKRMLAGDGEIVIVDVRSHGYYEPGSARIAGSIRLEPNQLSEELNLLPKDKDIFVYCTWAREATSARVALLLRQQGFRAFVIAGGLTAWRKAGQALELVPDGDLVKLPTFS